MRKKLFVILLVVICLIVVGCKKKEEKVGGWQIDLNGVSLAFPNDASDAFNEAIEKQAEWQFEPLALLGTQVVAGTNYMFLCKYIPMNGVEAASYKVVVIYKDLEGVATLSQVRDFDVFQYAGKDIEGTSEMLMGGWTVNTSTLDAKVSDEVMDAFEKATKDSKEKYTPILVIATQIVSGRNYAVLALKENTDGPASMNVLTIYQNLQKKAKVTANAYVNLADYN